MTLIWQLDKQPIDYNQAMQSMEEYVNQMITDNYPNKIWLCEHFDVYTGGTSSDNNEITNNKDIPQILTNRGGKWTYHGIGQRIIYPMINLQNTKDIKSYIFKLEQWIIDSLADLNVEAFRKENMVGIWVVDNNQDKKISAIGVRVKKWIAYHGIALNVACNLDNFNSIVPCGIRNFGVSSLQSLKKDVSYDLIDSILVKNFHKVLNND
jgi:lipoyl(octanoyl) transferase